MYIIYKLYAKSDLAKNPSYIGITATSLNTRLKRHLERSRCDYGKVNWPIINWINKIVTNQDEVIIEPIDFAQSKEEAFSKERYYIDKYKKEGFDLKNATSGGDGHKGYRIKQFTKTGEFVKLWECISEIETATGFSNSHISSCCKGVSRRKAVGGYVWRYEHDEFNTHTVEPDHSKKMMWKKIYQFNNKGEIIKVWNHSQQIEDELGFPRTGINHCCRNPILKLKSPLKPVRKSHGFYWSYESNKDIVQSLLKSKSIDQVDN